MVDKKTNKKVVLYFKYVITYSGEDSGVRLDISSWVGTAKSHEDTTEHEPNNHVPESMLKESRYSQTLPEANTDEARLIIQNLKSCLITVAISEPHPGLRRDRKRKR